MNTEKTAIRTMLVRNLALARVSRWSPWWIFCGRWTLANPI